MSLETIIGSFVKGLGSAVFKVSILKEALSGAVASGIECGINRSMPVLIKNIVLGSMFLTGVFLSGLGIAKWAEPLFATPGAGFILAGIVLIAAASIYPAITPKAA